MSSSDYGYNDMIGGRFIPAAWWTPQIERIIARMRNAMRHYQRGSNRAIVAAAGSRGYLIPGVSSLQPEVREFAHLESVASVRTCHRAVDVHRALARRLRPLVPVWVWRDEAYRCPAVPTY